jgi:3-oxoacyl-[acyl-carrier protein] reductase
MDLGLNNARVLVTAASRGLGFAVAKALVGEGVNVTISSRNEESLRKATRALGKNADYIQADVSRLDDIKKLAQEIGTASRHLDGLFVNSGGPPLGRFTSLSDSDWRSSLDLTLMSAVWLTRELLPLLRRSKSPSILYSTSISVKQPLDNLLLSNSIRAAVVGMMRTLASEIGPDGIRVNAVCPGYIHTERIEQILSGSEDRTDAMKAMTRSVPLGRIGMPEEFGRVCAFMLSPAASYIHGALLLVDGGFYRGMM